jgi:nicotinamidase-related amidase
VNRALIVIDAQQDYATGGRATIAYPPLETSTANLATALSAAAAAGIPLVVVRQVSPAGSWAFAEGSPGAHLLPQVAAAPAALVVDKRLASALAGTDLDAWLRAHRIDRLTLAGYMTQNCVESTARHARHLGYTLEVLSDATGTVGLATAAGELSARQVHQAALVVMASGFAAVGSTQGWCRSIATGQPWPTPSLATTVRPA